MKKLIISALLILGMVTPAYAVQFDWERQYFYLESGGRIFWRVSYDIGYFDNSLMVDVDIWLKGYNPGITLLDRWETGIESIWSTNRFSMPILFNVDWTSEIADHVVKIVQGNGRWDMGTWYSENAAYWGDPYQEKVAAHEFGHMIGCWDEYIGGAWSTVWGTGSGGLMETLRGGTLDYYYTPFLTWYESKLSASTNVSEPSTILLLTCGLIGVVGLRKKFRK